ncbi:MAG TPA: alanine racemase [Caldilineaceae bacterium]|nr:alanine racemase [Caldilineaceae bacterium]
MSEVGAPLTAVETPFLWTDLERLDRNIATMAAHFRGANVQWRPHTKGVKVPAIAHRLVAAGAIGVTCAKLGEAEVMAAAGIRNILVANQIVGPQKIARLVHLCRHADVKIVVDNRDVVSAIGNAATAAGTTVGLLVEVNTGMNRAGVEPGEATIALAQHIAATPGARLAGLMTWEGHTLSERDLDRKREKVSAAIKALTDTADACRALGLPIEIVSAGGSGTYHITPFLPGVTEIEAGGAIFCDVTYQGWGIDLEPALFVRTMVTSRPTPTRIICDAGFKTLPRGYATPHAIGIDHITEVAFSAEHGILKLDQPNTTLNVGDTFDFVVGYGDATVFLHEQLYGVYQGTVDAIWPVLGRGKIR